MAVTSRIDAFTGLTDAAEVFCQALATGSTQIDAWRKAYPQSKAGKSAFVRACNLAKNPLIVARLQSLRDATKAYTGITLIEHVQKLAELRDAAAGANQFGPAVTAEANRGKVSGLYVEKVEHSGNVSIFASRQDEDL